MDKRDKIGLLLSVVMTLCSVFMIIVVYTFYGWFINMVFWEGGLPIEFTLPMTLVWWYLLASILMGLYFFLNLYRKR